MLAQVGLVPVDGLDGLGRDISGMCNAVELPQGREGVLGVKLRDSSAGSTVSTIGTRFRCLRLRCLTLCTLLRLHGGHTQAHPS